MGSCCLKTGSNVPPRGGQAVCYSPHLVFLSRLRWKLWRTSVQTRLPAIARRATAGRPYFKTVGRKEIVSPSTGSG